MRAGRAFILMAAVWACAGCYSWRTTDVGTAVTMVEQRRAVRITLDDGRSVVLDDSRMEADTIVGFAGFDMVRAAPQDVRSFELRRLSAPRTTAFIVAQASIFLHAMAWIVHSQPHYRGLF